MLKYNNKGVSLVEAMVSVAILATGLLSIATLFPLIIKTSKTSEQETMAANLIQAKVEELFNYGYDNLKTGTIEPKSRLSQDPTNPFYNYQREVKIEYLDGNLNNSTSETGLKKITVTVYYNTSHLNLERALPVTVLIVKK
jgi:Tfp pilus assembly protein PilV